MNPVLAKIKVRPGKASSPEIQRIQFPIVLSWACTVHKVQGLTIEKVVISLDLKKQRSFNYRQIYVALGCATSLQGLYILGEMKSKHIKVNPKVNEEYEKQQDSSSYFNTLTKDVHSDDSVLTISLLNIRSLRKHSEDIKFHSQLFSSDVVALTETQLLLNDLDMEIKKNLEPFRTYRQDHRTDKYSSIAICVKPNLEVENYEYIPILNALKFDLVNTNLQESRSFLLLYRKNNSIVSQYMEALQYVINSSRIDMILGDFNINYLNEIHCQPL